MRVAGVATVFAAAACAGTIGDGHDPDGPDDGLRDQSRRSSGSTAPEAETSGSDVRMAPGAPSGDTANTGALRRLTATQYANSVRDLLGASLKLDVDLEPDTHFGGFVSVGAAQVAISASGVEKYEVAAQGLAQQAFSDPARWRTLVPCVPAGAADESCARAFVTAFGRRAFRRPLAPEEVETYLVVFRHAASALGDFQQALAQVVAAFLQSPSFIFRVELGAPDVGSGRYRLDDYEHATRLSYFLLDTTPSDALLDLAERGQLGSAEAMRREALQLLGTRRARSTLAGFFLEMMAVGHVAEVEKDAALFPHWTPTLAASALAETTQFVAEIALAPEANALSLFDSRETFLDAGLARLYGLPAPAGDALTRVTLPSSEPRAGILGKASFLAIHASATETSPTRRGVAIRQELLCQQIPEPPPNVPAELPPASDGPAGTMRQRLAEHASNATCAACHSLTDPLGLALETFDSTGAFRERDHGLVIDTSGEIDGVRFADARELGRTLRQHPAAAACMVRQLYRFAIGQMEGPAQKPLLERLEAAFRTGQHRFNLLAAELAASDGFRFIAPPVK
jgi:hypothetical protein